MPWLRQLVTGLSLRRSKFAPGSVHVGFLVNREAFDRFFTEFFLFLLSVSFQRGSAPIYHLGINNKPTDGRSSETPSRLTDMNNNNIRSRVSSVSIVSDYGLDNRAIGVRSPAGGKDFSSSLCVQTGSGAHPASCTMGTVGPFPGGKERPSSAEVVNE
jgi:hypothetical protein